MDSIEKAIQAVLPQLDEAKLETLVNELVKVGVEGPDDLQFIQEDDIKHLLTPIQCRKIIHSLKVCNAGPSNPQLSPSSSEPLSVAYSSTCPISSISPISAWVNSFEVPWNKVRLTLRRAVDAGETILTAKKWMLSIEGKVLIPPGAHMADFTTALAALFACYYVFNLEYQVEASTTLEFVQRFLVRINPDSNKCTAKEQMSKTTGRVVKRKTSYMNPHVISFIRDFTEFYLLTD
ncbi:uncharacterized protein LOC127970748 isoform X2 [Carassius gibelio]|uniref:uncharacterized protein LOC127970748 isoform X2 n=1 Tax=Carassius gibelio TaxID=101364 RepID=UPI0022791FAB|nr:uncharacterized protein LOC127970748 isoform X2 [Carassius gibelio]